jgi:predicted NAD-dependent protein-ADP-ribosyltransferase YbiA (DUF1768 family)
MFTILKDKFSRNPDLYLKLRQTSPKLLVEENWWGDQFWGCVNGVGQNSLGRILMDIRDLPDLNIKDYFYG